MLNILLVYKNKILNFELTLLKSVGEINERG